MSATSSRTRATAGGQTASISSIARSGVFAIEFSSRQCACVGVAEQPGALGAQLQDLA
jgi:hypothetical protein